MIIMKTTRIIGSSDTRLLAVLLGLALAIAGTGVSRAMSELVSITIAPEWPSNTNPGNVTLYTVTVTRVGQGMLDVSLTADGLPAGATASFGAGSLRFTGRTPEMLSTTLTLTCTNPTATDNVPFTVTGTSLRGALTVINQNLTWKSRLASPSAGTILALDRLSDGSLKIRGHGPVSGVYLVEATPDLASPAWAPVSSTAADGNGRFICINATPSQVGSRFYRTVNPAHP
jgi:hypothetical protein